MPKSLVDLLWRDSPHAPVAGRRGPRSRRSLSDVVDGAVTLADASGLDALTIRSLAEALGISAMSMYTHINTRDDLLVLMADTAHARMALPPFGRAGWRARVTRVAESNRQLFVTHPWLLHVTDQRVALGPGTIAKYDHELHAFDGTGLTDVDRDAALTFVLNFVAAGAAAQLRPAQDFDTIWAESAARLERYVGQSHPLARRIGQAAGEAMGAPYSATRAWTFGLQRVLAGLREIIEAD